MLKMFGRVRGGVYTLKILKNAHFGDILTETQLEQLPITFV